MDRIPTTAMKAATVSEVKPMTWRERGGGHAYVTRAVETHPHDPETR